MKRLEKVFAASAFAESGEQQEAREIAGIPSSRQAGLGWDRVFAAAAFAEAGCPEHALEFMGARRPEARTLTDFLETVGLGDVRICYGLAEI